MSAPERLRAAAAVRKRFEAVEQQAVEAAARWIGHPALRGVIERRRLGAEAVVIPIARMLTDQKQVIRFCRARTQARRDRAQL